MNKFVLVDANLYKGLMEATMGPRTGNQNLDFAKRSLEKSKRERAVDASTRNINVNQALRRYLNIKDDYENKPVRVELAGGPPMFINKSRGSLAYYTDSGDAAGNESLEATEAFTDPKENE